MPEFAFHDGPAQTQRAGRRPPTPVSIPPADWSGGKGGDAGATLRRRDGSHRQPPPDGDPADPAPAPNKRAASRLKIFDALIDRSIADIRAAGKPLRREPGPRRRGRSRAMRERKHLAQATDFPVRGRARRWRAGPSRRARSTGASVTGHRRLRFRLADLQSELPAKSGDGRLTKPRSRAAPRGSARGLAMRRWPVRSLFRARRPTALQPDRPRPIDRSASATTRRPTSCPSGSSSSGSPAPPGLRIDDGRGCIVRHKGPSCNTQPISLTGSPRRGGRVVEGARLESV